MDELLGIPLGQLTINGLALIVISLVSIGLIRGFLIPRATHERELKRADLRAADYRELWETADRRADTLEQVAGNVVTIGETMTKVLKSLPTPYQEAASPGEKVEP